MLIVRRRITRLRRPKTRLIDQRLVVGHEHAAARRRDDLVAVKGKYTAQPDGARRDSCRLTTDIRNQTSAIRPPSSALPPLTGNASTALGLAVRPNDARERGRSGVMRYPSSDFSFSAFQLFSVSAFQLFSVSAFPQSRSPSERLWFSLDQLFKPFCLPQVR